MSLFDLIIIGAGPAGMTAAIYARRKGLSIQIITDSVGGQVVKTGDVENYPGYGKIPGPKLASLIKKQLDNYNVDIKMTRAVNIERAVTGFKVTCGSGNTYESRAIIIASGSRWRELNVPGEKEYQNKGVSYCTTCDGPLFAGMDVAVVGGGNTAVEAVLDLINTATKIYLLVRGTMKADKVLVDRIKESSKVIILMGYSIEKISGTDFVESIDVASSEGEHKTLKVGGVFAEVGFVPNVSFVKDLVKLNEKGEIIIDEYCRTSVPGIYACGDVTTVPQKQIIVAAGEGAKAAMSVYTYICTQGCEL
jgi:NADH-dependent peroxiredoxin subunit F